MKDKMFKFFVCMVAMLIVGVMGVSMADSSPALERRKARRAKEKVDSPVGGEYYLMSNIWHEYPKDILSTNFHRGTMIPFGTKVVIDKYRGTKIKFTDQKTGITHTYVHAKKHSKIRLRELFDRYFSKEDLKRPGGPFEKFTPMEKENIKNSKLDIGMSKDAAIMAYGYPPTHRTPSLSDTVWTYWKGRAGRFLVTFKDNKISYIQY